MANYFTDIVGGTREAFQRGYENVGNIRRDIGEQQAARALARGDTRAAKQAYGRAGMAEQVDVLGQREEAQAEAMRKRQEDMAEAERKRTIEDQDRAARQAKAQSENAVAQFTALGGYADALLQLRPEDRKAAWMNILRPAVVSMGMPQEALAQMDAADFSDDNLRLFARAMGDEKEKLKPQYNVSQGAVTIFNPNTGELTYQRAPGAPTPSTNAGGSADKGNANAAPPLSQTDARNAVRAFSAIPSFRSALQNFKEIVSKVGVGAISGIGPDASKLKSAHRALAMQLKGEAGFNLGALVGADFNLLNDMIGDPGDPVKFYAEGGKAGALEKLKQIEQFLNDREMAIRDQYSPYASNPLLERYYSAPTAPPPPGQGAFLVLRPGARGAPPPSPQARAGGSQANPPPYATAEEREYWSDMTPEEKAAVWAGE